MEQKSIILTITQPAFLPWLSYFQRINKSDVVVFLDHVQFERRGHVHRNKILNQNKEHWISLPLKKKGNYYKSINKMELVNKSDWSKKLTSKIINFYNLHKKKESKELIEEIFFYNNQKKYLIDYLINSNEILFKVLNIKTKVLYSSELILKKTKSDLILEICEKIGASKYISGPMGRDYLNLEKFRAKEIDIVFHDTYENSRKLSVIDDLFLKKEIDLNKNIFLKTISDFTPLKFRKKF